MIMKKYIFTLIALVAMVLTASATDLTGKRIYVNPGHGSFGPNDRPMATIPFPNLSSTGMPDTCGFYETNTNLWKCQYLRDRLVQAGATVVMSREANGPWPYQKVNGQYPDYTWADYQSRPDYEMYNRPLSEISEEVEAGNFDLFISVHSNAITDGNTTNYPLFLYRGYDAATSEFEQTCKAIGQTIWPYRFDMFAAGYEPASAYSLTSQNVRGDVSFMGSGSNSTRSCSGKTYYGYYGVLKHGVPGGLWEGYFHTYQPGRHRALNHDHCHIEGLSYFRGIMAYFGATPDTHGYICGTVKDMDNKISHGLYKYAARTNDQWMPCNGATVYLLNATGDTLQSYQVDSFYNGTFVFYDLQPGVYHLAAKCDGYYDLDEEQRMADVEVTANTTTFPFLFLRDTTWAPPAVVYENYPDKSSGVTGLDGQYNFSQATEVDFSAVVAGKVVRQVLVRDDRETYVLALDTTAKTSHIYRINTLTGALIETVSTEGATGETYPIYNLAFTADSVLMGASYGMNEFDASRVPEGRLRGTWSVYYWNMDSLAKAPKAFINSQLSGNFYTAWVGRSFAVSGTLGNATVYTDALTTGMTNIRVMQFVVDSFSLVSACRNQDAGILTLGNYGDYQQITSPCAADRSILLGELKGAEFGWAGDAQVPLYGFTLPATKGGQAFKYAGQDVVAAPVLGAAGQVQSVNLYNLTAGRSVLGVTTTNIATNLVASYCSVKPLANGKDIILYVATEDHIYRYTTAGVTQPSFRNIFAYDLKATAKEGSYDLTFSFNTQPTEATIHIYSEEGLEVKTIPVTAPQQTGNVVNLPLPIDGLDENQAYRWGVEASAPEVGNWAIAEQKTAASMGMTRVFNAVNVYPETEHFGTIYLVNYVSKTSDKNGLYVMNPDLTLQNTTPYRTTNNPSAGVYRTPYRLGIDNEGTVYLSDWDDTHSGVYVVDPENPSGVHQAFFAGAQSGTAGVWKNAAGVEEGSSSPSAYVYSRGANAKLLVYNEDPGSTLPTNGLCIYNIGQPDGSILHQWDGAPSAKINFEGQANTNGNVWGCTKGVWVSQHRSAGNNNASATSLRFYSWDGHCTFASHLEPTFPDGTLVIDGSLGSCFALSDDEKFLALRGTDKNIQLFDVAWNDSTPTLTYKGDFKNELAGEFDLLQMNWDYAGNLIASGNAGLVIIAVPKEGNRCFTPASEQNKLINGKLPFDHCLYEPAEATLSTWFTTTAWIEETNSTATLDSLGDIHVNIVDAKNERWQAQVKLNTGLDLDENKLYSLTFSVKASANIPGVTVRMFEGAVIFTDSTINLNANEEVTYFADSIDGKAGNGVLVFDFGFSPANTTIDITDIAICEVGDKPHVVYEHLYELGDNQSWNPAAGVELTAKSENVFEGTFTFNTTYEYGYFTFVTELNSSWDVVNAHRFGPVTADELVTIGDVNLFSSDKSFKIANGTYVFTVDLNSMKLTIAPGTGLDNISDEHRAVKFLRNGQIFIRKDGHTYNAAGILVE